MQPSFRKILSRIVEPRILYEFNPVISKIIAIAAIKHIFISIIYYFLFLYQFLLIAFS